MKKIIAILLVCLFCFNIVTVNAAIPTYTVDYSDNGTPTLGLGKSKVYIDAGSFKFVASTAGTYKIKLYDFKCTTPGCKIVHNAYSGTYAVGERYNKRKKTNVSVNYGNTDYVLNLNTDDKATFTCKMKKGDIVYISNDMGYVERGQFLVKITKKK